MSKNLNRDQCPLQNAIYNEATSPAKAKYAPRPALKRRLTMVIKVPRWPDEIGYACCSSGYAQSTLSEGMLTVASAYWRRGHATRLVSWCTRLADLEGVPVVRIALRDSEMSGGLDN